MYRFILPVALLIGSGAALSADGTENRARQQAREQAGLDRALTGLVPGKPQSCLSRFGGTYNTQRFGDTILYRQNSRTIYRTDTGGGCFGLRNGDTIVTKSATGDMCRGDIVRTVDLVSHTPSGACTFGDFIPYTKRR